MSADDSRAILIGPILALLAVGAFVALPFALVFGPRVLDSVRATPTETGCGADLAGPAALIGFDPASGAAEWTQLVGLASVVDVSPGLIELESDLSGSSPLTAVRRSFDPVSAKFTACDEGAVPAFVEDAVGNKTFDFNMESTFDHPADVSVQISNERTRSIIEGYRGSDLLWSAEVPVFGWSAWAAIGTPDTIVVAAGTEVTLLRVETGDVVWTVDHGSPGDGGFFNYYNEPGAYRQFWFDADLDQYIGLIRANAPYRD